MNLLTDNWIPVRSSSGTGVEQISLRSLLCGEEPQQLCLPRDDMEMAATELLISVVQIIWPPEDMKCLEQRMNNPLSGKEFNEGVKPWLEAFDLNHSQHPFMQVKGVAAKDVTDMDKLMVGLTGSTNCAFINQPGQAEALCGGCTAIALFNQANNAPGFGGGFKSGLRGGTPLTTLVQQPCLRRTLWVNTLTQQNLDVHYPGWRDEPKAPFTWLQPIKSNATIAAGSIGLARGLLWQPAHIELSPPSAGGVCSACGSSVEQRYRSFLKAKFNYTVDGLWLHPFSPRVLQFKKGVTESRYPGFTTLAPSWTQIGRMLISQQLDKQSEGRIPALNVEQARKLFNGRRMHLSVGGYRNNQASILERRHDVMVFNQGWERHLDVIREIVRMGLDYRKGLWSALSTFTNGIPKTDIEGTGVEVFPAAERQYYRQSDVLITSLLATIDYDDPFNELDKLHQQLASICRRLFEESTEPYAHHPKVILTLAAARRVLHKQIAALQPQGEQADGIEA